MPDRTETSWAQMVLLAGSLLGIAAFLTYMVRASGWGGAGVVIAAVWLVDSLVHRFRTRVTAQDIRTRHLFWSRNLPVHQARELIICDWDGFPDPVFVRTEGGHRRHLPRVSPENVEEISALTGLAVQDRRS